MVGKVTTVLIAEDLVVVVKLAKNEVARKRSKIIF
jgi:hypothetical protein